MDWGTQQKIVDTVKISNAFLSQIINGHRRPSYRIGKKLAEATNTPLKLWMEGTSDEIKTALSKTNNSEATRGTKEFL